MPFDDRDDSGAELTGAFQHKVPVNGGCTSSRHSVAFRKEWEYIPGNGDKGGDDESASLAELPA